MFAEDLSAHGIELSSRHTRRDGIHHGLASFCDDSACTDQRVELLLAVNSHVLILRPKVLYGVSPWCGLVTPLPGVLSHPPCGQAEVVPTVARSLVVERPPTRSL